MLNVEWLMLDDVGWFGMVCHVTCDVVKGLMLNV